MSVLANPGGLLGCEENLAISVLMTGRDLALLAPPPEGLARNSQLFGQLAAGEVLLPIQFHGQQCLLRQDMLHLYREVA